MQKEYLIHFKEGGYLYRNEDNSYCKTASYNKALKLSYNKADNILKTAIKPDQRQAWEIVSIDERHNCDSILNTPFNEKGIDWAELSAAQQELYNSIIEYNENLNSSLSQVDKEICDIEHYIEFTVLSAAKGYQVYRMLRDRLLNRRSIKDEMLRVDYFIASTGMDLYKGKVLKTFKKIEKRKYKPRRLDELFDMEKSEANHEDVSSSNLLYMDRSLRTNDVNC